MARPYKQGVDYFPLDVYLDDKFKFIEIKFNLAGFAIVIKLLQKIYSCGYWYRWTDDEILLFADETRAKKELISDVVIECLERDIFNQQLYDKYQILTSNGIQRRYKEIVRRRKDIELQPEYLLIDDMMTTSCRHDDDTNEQRKGNRKETEKKRDETDKKTNPSLQIFNLRSRFSVSELSVIDKYFDILRGTRKTGKISDSVTEKIYQEWNAFPIDKVIYSLNVCINNPKYHDKRESYLLGIMKNVTDEEINKKKNSNGQGDRMGIPPCESVLGEREKPWM